MRPTPVLTAEKTKLRNQVDFGRKIKIKKVKKVVDR